jgi:transcriptional regulator with XRE-family HTH domain
MSEWEHWRKLIEELQAKGITLEKIAESCGVTLRQVSNWKTGDRPLGLTAVKLEALRMRVTADVSRGT